MTSQELFRQGDLEGAIAAVQEELRRAPADRRRRTFLFELLCFAGEYDRAEKQLDMLARGSPEAGMGALLYRSALHAARIRRTMFESGEYPRGVAPPPAEGTLNGRAFSALQDADPRIGARLEVFAAGQYTWLPFGQVAAVRMEPPRRLRDLLWAPARIQTSPEYQGLELGEVLIPVLAPLTWRHADPDVRLGRRTEFEPLADGTVVPVGQKVFLVDDEPLALLEFRELRLAAPAAAET